MASGVAKTLLTLLAGPALALALAAGAPASEAYWDALAELAYGGPYRADALVHRARAPAVVVFGSSVALRDINEALLSKALDEAEVVNLGINGATLAASAMWAPDIARLAPDVALLVVGAAELNAAGEPDWLTRYDPRIAWPTYGLRGVLRRPEDHLDGLVGWLYPVYRHQPGLRRRVLDGPSDTPHPRFKGHLPDSRMAPQLAGVGQRLAGQVLDGSGPNADALRAAARTLTRAGVTLVVCPAPLHPEIATEGSTYAPLIAVLDQLAGELGLIALSAEAVGQYPGRAFVDPLHLGLPGQRRLTRRVAGQLAGRLR